LRSEEIWNGAAAAFPISYLAGYKLPLVPL